MNVVFTPSMKTQSLSKIVVVSLLSTLAMGCTGNVFDSQGNDSKAGKNDGKADSSPLASESLKVSSISADDMLRNLLAENFSATFATYNTGPKQYFEFEVDIPYARVYKPLSQLVRKFAPQVCKLANFAYAGDGVYHNEELPCGYPDNDNIWKSIFTVNIPGLNGWSGDVYYDIYNFQVPIKIGRANQTGPYTEDSLDTNGNANFQSSKTLGEDVSFRFRPHGNVADFDVCMNVPGTTITTSPMYLYGNAYKKILGISVTLSANAVVRPGIVSYQYIRQCFSARAGFDGNTGNPIYQLTKITNPDVIGAQLNYTQLDFQDWFTNLVQDVLKVFGTNINQQIKQYIQETAYSYTENDVQNGQFLLNVARSTLGDEWTGKVSDAMAGRVAEEIVPSSGINLKNALKTQCDRLSSLLSQYDTNRLDPEKCRAFLDMIDLHLVPFKYDADLDAKGCYSHYANIHKANTGSDTDYWWKTECKFKVKAIIGIPKTTIDEIKVAVTDLFRTLRDEIQLAPAFTAASVSTSGLHLDGVTLDKILKRMKDEGYRNIAREDLTEYIRKNGDAVRALAMDLN